MCNVEASGAMPLVKVVNMPRHTGIKIIIKAMFLGAFFLGLIGLGAGGVAAVLIWPGSNLGPPVGAVYGLLIGIMLGAALGCIFGLVRFLKPRIRNEDSHKTHKTHRTH